MTYEETYNRWLQLTEEKKVLERKRQETADVIQLKNDHLSTYLASLKKEEKDVENLEKTSISSFLSKFTGQFEEKLQKEQEEFLHAKLTYEDKKNELEILRQKEHRLLTELPIIDQKIAFLKKSLQSDYPEGVQFSKDLEEKKEHLFHLQKELEEALEAVQLVLGYAQTATDEFSKAKGWSTFDTFFGGGFIADLAKYSKIDEANKIISKISAATKDMKKELQDVEINMEHQLSTVSGGEQFFDIAFDNIFSDWSIRDKIEKNMGAMMQYTEELHKIEKQILSALKETQKKLASL